MTEINTPRQIGSMIREERQRRGLTQQQLADLSGVSRGFIARLEKGSSAAVYPEKLFSVLAALELRMTLSAPQAEPSTERDPAADSSFERLSATVAKMAEHARRMDSMIPDSVRELAESLEDLPRLSPRASDSMRELAESLEDLPRLSPRASDSLREAAASLRLAQANQSLSETSSLFAPRSNPDTTPPTRKDRP